MRVKHRREGKYNFIFFNAGGTADYEDSPRDKNLSRDFFMHTGAKVKIIRPGIFLKEGSKKE